MEKIALPIIALLLLGTVFAVTLNTSSIAQVGGTGAVAVLAPDADGTLESVTFIQENTAPYHISAVNVTWTPASSTATYNVSVTLYDATNTIIAYGAVSQAGASGSVSTIVPLNTVADPKDIYYVEVVIVQT